MGPLEQTAFTSLLTKGTFDEEKKEPQETNKVAYTKFIIDQLPSFPVSLFTSLHSIEILHLNL